MSYRKFRLEGKCDSLLSSVIPTESVWSFVLDVKMRLFLQCMSFERAKIQPWLTLDNSSGSEKTIPAKTTRIATFPSPNTFASYLVAARLTTDVATATRVAEEISICVPGRDTSLVVESSTIPDIPIRRSERVRKPTSTNQRSHLQVAMRTLRRGMMFTRIYMSLYVTL